MARTPVVWLTSKGCHTALIALIVPGAPLYRCTCQPTAVHRSFETKKMKLLRSARRSGNPFYPLVRYSREKAASRLVSRERNRDVFSCWSTSQRKFLLPFLFFSISLTRICLVQVYKTQLKMKLKIIAITHFWYHCVVRSKGFKHSVRLFDERDARSPVVANWSGSWSGNKSPKTSVRTFSLKKILLSEVSTRRRRCCMKERATGAEKLLRVGEGKGERRK